MPRPFEITLKKKHRQPKVISYTNTDAAIELQALRDANNDIQFNIRRDFYAEQDRSFRVTKGIVYETKPYEFSFVYESSQKAALQKLVDEGKKETAIALMNEYASNKELQSLYQNGDESFDSAIKDCIEEHIVLFKITDNTVQEVHVRKDIIDVEIKLQVKGYSLTWYFWAEGAMDQYPQEFRDKLYNAAAICERAHTI